MMLGSVQSTAGEAPYLKLISQPVGNRILVANVIGCSSIARGYLPTTPWRQNTEALRLTALVKEASAVRRKTYQHM
ncbi:MAG: pyruvate/2-oxoacid:ferredoxin oxidoreductase beta subunit [Reinekea sp.]|jgi:pyruvate/2-oxoacid:ferredoxin oxidoreductase beta subunit